MKAPTKEEYLVAKSNLAICFTPHIYPCKKCGWTVISGYCCTSCGDTDPSVKKESSND